MSEDRYLDSSAFILRLSNLPDEEALRELGKAAKHCEVEEKHHQTKADQYMLAKAAYVAEAHKRTALPRGGWRKGKKVGFAAWIKENGVSRNYADTLAKIANSDNPMEALLEWRRDAAWRNKKSTLINIRVTKNNPLLAFRKLWGALSEEQKAEAIQWIYSPNAKQQSFQILEAAE